MLYGRKMIKTDPAFAPVRGFMLARTEVEKDRARARADFAWRKKQDAVEAAKAKANAAKKPTRGAKKPAQKVVLRDGVAFSFEEK